MTKTYVVTEIFPTLQGEGFHAGTPAVFLRFSSCNLWSGKAEHRERDAARNGAKCPLWCDTDFTPQLKLTAEEICNAILDAARHGGMNANVLPLLVISGGEPLLQLDDELIAAIDRRMHVRTIAVETNGTVEPKLAYLSRLWLTCSPKTPADRVKLRHFDEIKVVFPAYDPEEYEHLLQPNTPRFIQPEAVTDIDSIGKSVVHKVNMLSAADWVMKHPRWRLSIQTHKLLGLP